MMESSARPLLFLCLVALLLTAACDTTDSGEEPYLVIQGFMDTGKPLPTIRVQKTLSPSSPFDPASAAVSDAEVSVLLGSRSVSYTPLVGRPGIYAPSADVIVDEKTPFSLHIRWLDNEAQAAGTVPPDVRIEKLHVLIPEEPVSAVLLDSLTLSDSLAVGARTGFIYPIEVSISWIVEAGTDDLWIRAQLHPYTAFSSTVVDLFLRSDQILLEEDVTPGEDGLRTWTGVYAVGVESKDDPLPAHKLRVALVRSGADYARFASTKNAPERRAPVSNVTGGTGIFTAISVDSTHLRVEQSAVTPIITPSSGASPGRWSNAAGSKVPRPPGIEVVPADERTTRALVPRLSN